jgi:uncharacterized phage-associated protein
VYKRQVFRSQPLFYQDIEAWVSGPVVRDVWHEYEAYKYSDIPSPNNFDEEFDEDESEVLEEVWNAYGELSAKHLAELTHSEMPWLNARKGLETAEKLTNIISHDDMKSCYAPLTIFKNRLSGLFHNLDPSKLNAFQLESPNLPS